MTTPIITLIIGFVLGIGVAFLLKIINAKNARDLAAEMYRETEAQRQQEVEKVLESVKDSFGSLSLEALSKSTEQFLKLAKERLETETQAGSKELESKKSLIDQQLKNMTGELEKVGVLMKDLEKDRVEKFGQLDRQLRVAGEQTNQLMQTTGQLREALASTKARGQWGERMAEDVLRIAGFVENVNYRKQLTMESSGTRPDYTFLLPQSYIVNMDVKFPLDNYMRFLDAESSGDAANAEEHKKQFLRDVKGRIKEVVGKEYINPAQNTLDYVLLFIPNEQVYAFIHAQDKDILDDGLRQHVVLCSPITLFAVLAVIRQAMDNFNLESTARQFQKHLAEFYKQYKAFGDTIDTLGKRLESAQKAFNDLDTTRRKKLEKPLNLIEELRLRQGITSDLPGEIPPPPEAE